MSTIKRQSVTVDPLSEASVPSSSLEDAKQHITVISTPLCPQPGICNSTDSFFRNCPMKPRNRLAVGEVNPNREGLRRLMECGSWRAASMLATQLVQSGVEIHEELEYRLCKILSLMKLRNYVAVFDEFQVFNDFEDTRYQYESYGDRYSMTGSMVPFSLRLYYAQLPYFAHPGGASTSEALVRLYQLLQFCDQHHQTAQQHSDPQPSNRTASTVVVSADEVLLRQNEDTDTQDSTAHLFRSSSDVSAGAEFLVENSTEGQVKLWRFRLVRVILALVHFNLASEAQQSWVAISRLLQRLADLCPNSLDCHEYVGRVWLQLGDISAAERHFKEVAGLDTDSEQTKTLTNSSLIHIARAQYDQALAQLQQLNASHPEDVHVASNTALCYVYMGRVMEAVRIYESTIQINPVDALTELFVQNLVALYDLAYDDHSHQRAKLQEFVALYGEEGFDVRVLKLAAHSS